MNKFTPGPWTEKGWAITGPAAVDANAAKQGIEEFAEVLGRKALCVTVAQAKPGHRAVAVVLGATQAEVDANARLIAAAPDLLAHAEMARDGIGKWLSAALDDPAACHAFKADIRAWLESNHAAIAKATGETP